MVSSFGLCTKYEGYETFCHSGACTTKDIAIRFEIRLKFALVVQNLFNWSQWNFAHVTTVLLSWRVQNFLVIGRICYEQEYGEISFIFYFDRNIVSQGLDPTLRAVIWLDNTSATAHTSYWVALLLGNGLFFFFFFTQISWHSSIEILEVLNISKLRTISVYIDVNFICLWYTWGQNVLLQNWASKNPALFLECWNVSNVLREIFINEFYVIFIKISAKRNIY